MRRISLEQRVAELENQVAELGRQLTNGTGKKDWRDTVGMFPELDEVFAEALKRRAADRKKARRGPKKAKPASP